MAASECGAAVFGAWIWLYYIVLSAHKAQKHKRKMQILIIAN